MGRDDATKRGGRMKRGDRARMSVCAYVCIRVRVILVVEGDLWDRLGLASSGGRGSV